MNTFYIKVNSAHGEFYWYSGHIGETFEVVGAEHNSNGDNFIVEVDGDKETFLVSWIDCELVVA
jgi:hypothetical protein